ncbi:MAG: VWA domain-containing protein [Lachnospiraceae bacterium]|nr:VWA domain-containing protein [Lachnospiraceae bacterium]
MKKKTIAALLIGAIATTSLMGCGSGLGNTSADTSTSPTYIEPEYPASTETYEYPSTSEMAEYPEESGSADYMTEAESYAPSTSADTSSAGNSSADTSSAAYEEAAEADSYANSSSAQSSTTASKESYEESADVYAYNEGYAYSEGCYAYTDPYSNPYCPDYWGYDYYDYGYGYNYGENYQPLIENAFTDAVSSPLSTFGADIDTASYANLRRMINDGYRLSEIPVGSVRTEELVNYFNYDYRMPGQNDTFAVNASIIDCPWNKETKLVNLGIKAKELEDIDDVASNIVFLVDVSGSMDSYDKLPLLQMGLDTLVDDLDENDRVSIVTYASSSDVVIAGVPGDKHTKIKRAINNLTASGSTNGGDGIRSAYKLAEKYFIKDGNNRVIMATDGDLNVGITSVDELEELISDKKENGVFLSVLGFGTGNYNDVTLETLADKGNGNYSYIDCLSEAKKVLVDEFNSTLFTVAKDVKFQIEFNPKYVSEYRLVGYENRQMAAQDFSDDTKDGGEIGSGHAMTIMYEIKMNEAKNDETSALRYQNTDLSEAGALSNEWMMVSVRYKEPTEDESRLITFPISNECYTKTPNCDTLFAAYVAECGMILNDSRYTGNLRITDVSKQVSKLDLDDEYKEEFLELIRNL